MWEKWWYGESNKHEEHEYTFEDEKNSMFEETR